MRASQEVPDLPGLPDVQDLPDLLDLPLMPLLPDWPDRPEVTLVPPMITDLTTSRLDAGAVQHGRHEMRQESESNDGRQVCADYS